MLPGGHVICYRNDRITYSQELIQFLFYFLLCTEWYRDCSNAFIASLNIKNCRGINWNIRLFCTFVLEQAESSFVLWKRANLIWNSIIEQRIVSCFASFSSSLMWKVADQRRTWLFRESTRAGELRTCRRNRWTRRRDLMSRWVSYPSFSSARSSLHERCCATAALFLYTVEGLALILLEQKRRQWTYPHPICRSQSHQKKTCMWSTSQRGPRSRAYLYG